MTLRRPPGVGSALAPAPVGGIDVETADDRPPADQQAGPAVDLERWGALAESVLVSEGIAGPAELALTFVDEAHMSELNATYMGESGPTDVLSFPLDADAAELGPGPPALRLLGDVVICPVIAARNVADQDSPDAYDAELALLVVHGVLHILGWDHGEPEEAAEMVARERRHLARVGLPRP